MDHIPDIPLIHEGDGYHGPGGEWYACVTCQDEDDPAAPDVGLVACYLSHSRQVELSPLRWPYVLALQWLGDPVPLCVRTFGNSPRCGECDFCRVGGAR